MVLAEDRAHKKGLKQIEYAVIKVIIYVSAFRQY